jgi:hypothetical protein
VKPIAVGLVFVWSLLLSLSASAGWLAKPDEPIPLEQPLVEWCQVSPSLPIEILSRDGCSWQPLEKGGGGHGFSRDAFWVRLELENAGVAPLERWIKVGHPRLAEISLFMRGPAGWVRQEVGNRTPMVARGDVEREFGMFPVTVPPGDVNQSGSESFPTRRLIYPRPPGYLPIICIRFSEPSFG